LCRISSPVSYKARNGSVFIGRSLKLSTHNLRVPRIRRTEEDIPPLPLYSYMVREWTTSLFYPPPL